MGKETKQVCLYVSQEPPYLLGEVYLSTLKLCLTQIWDSIELNGHVISFPLILLGYAGY